MILRLAYAFLLLGTMYACSGPNSPADAAADGTVDVAAPDVQSPQDGGLEANDAAFCPGPNDLGKPCSPDGACYNVGGANMQCATTWSIDNDASVCPPCP